jgi:hypothetical protein
MGRCAHEGELTDDQITALCEGRLPTCSICHPADNSAAHEPVVPTFHGLGVRVPPGEDYVTESGQRVENRSDRVMEFRNSDGGLRPPPEHADKLLHWLGAPDGQNEPWAWNTHDGKEWWASIGNGHETAKTMAGYRYRYLGPAEWDHGDGARGVITPGSDGAAELIVGAYMRQGSLLRGVIARKDARIAALEADNADLATLLAAARDRVSADAPPKMDDISRVVLEALVVEQRRRLIDKQEQVGRLMCRIDQLEREVAAMNHPSFADRAEAELVERAMPANALKHSR